LEWARELLPDAIVTVEASDIVRHPDLDVVGIFTLADIRPHLLLQALQHGKHVIAEKPLAASVTEEKKVLAAIESSDRIVTVNLFNRNAWYHAEIQAFIDQGEIGRLAAILISHQTPGLMPTEGHQPEGPPFHDCGMHYVDVARWYARSEYDRWDAQGLRLWGWKDPWWVQAHGSFRNGVAFSITQGFAYGQMAESRVNRCGLDVIGTKGVVRMEHDFGTVSIDYHGVTQTRKKTGPYGGKKLDVLCERFADSLDVGHAVGLPSARDSVVASEVSQAMLDFARQHAAPNIGDRREMEEILEYRARRRQKAEETNPVERRG
jgi:myo-inositol 2-dehydrogenase/D-chiro-inositol 1-dehydrogenase